jgi:hypothetical protein
MIRLALVRMMLGGVLAVAIILGWHITSLWQSFAIGLLAGGIICVSTAVSRD